MGLRRPSSYLCRTSLPRFRNLAHTCRVFVSSRRLSVPLFRGPRTRCGIIFVGLSLAFCTTYEIYMCIFVHRVRLQTRCGIPTPPRPSQNISHEKYCLYRSVRGLHRARLTGETGQGYRVLVIAFLHTVYPGNSSSCDIESRVWILKSISFTVRFQVIRSNIP